MVRKSESHQFYLFEALGKNSQIRHCLPAHRPEAAFFLR
jgi:hypothetical protein